MFFKRLRTLALIGLVSLSLAARADDKGSGPKSGVRDSVGMFSAEATTKADETLAALRDKTRWQTVIETVESLEGKTPSEAANANAKALGIHGVYVLIAKKETKVQVEASRSAQATFSKEAEKAIVDAFVNGFRAKNFDQGLVDAVALIKADAEAKPAPDEPSPVPADVYDQWTGGKPGVRDSAGMFSADAVKRAIATLADVHRNTHWQGVIETVETLGGKSPSEVAPANAKQNQVHGVYVLIAKKETKIQVEASRTAKGTFTKEADKAIVEALTKGFRAKNFDQGLLDAVDQIKRDAEAKPDVSKGADRSKTPVAAIASAASSSKTVPPIDNPPAVPPLPDAAPPPRAEAGGGGLWLLILGGVGIVLVLWSIARSFKQPQQPGFQNPGGYATNPNPNRGPAPQGYGPAPGPAGYYPPQGQPYGPAPMPQQGGGGGFISGALGGLGGAVVGNILYDQFGRPHQAPAGHEQPFPHHDAGMLPPTQDVNAGAWPDAPASAPQPAESYDPNAGVGGDWGSNDPAPEPDAGAGGDWGAPDPAPEPDAGAGGDWGGDSGGGSADQGQGGSW